MKTTSPLAPGNAAHSGRPGQTAKPIKHLRFSVASFLAVLLLLLVVTPFVESIKNGDFLEAVLVTLVLGTGLLAAGVRRGSLAFAFLLALLAVVGKWTTHFWPERVSAALYLVPALTFFVFLVICLLGFIVRAREVDSEVLCAGVSIYLLLGALWGVAYMLVAQLVPNAFTFSAPAPAGNIMNAFNALYFSFITLTTVGYGDITPVANAARMRAMLEAMTGTLFVGMLIARLVSIYSAPGSKPAGDPPGQA